MSTSGVTVVTTDDERKQFINFQYTHYEADGHFIPPLKMDQKKLIDEKKNPFYQNAEIKLFLAEHKGEIAGRIGAVVDHRYNEYHNTKTGHFAFFECIDHQPTADLLLRVAEDWLRDKGMEDVLGPTAPGMMDVIGFLVDGFDKDPYILMPYTKPFYEKLVTNAGYKGEMDLLAYIVHKDTVSLERGQRAKEIVKRRIPGLVVRPVNLKNIKSEIDIVGDIYTETWKNNWGFLPITKEEFAALAEDLKLVLDPDLAHIAEVDGKPVAFSVGIPDLNQIFKTMDGKLFPFGIFKILFQRKKINRFRTALMGVIPEYQGKGIDALLHQAAIEKALPRGIYESELSWILGNNQEMIRVAEKIGGRLDKTYRMFSKKL